jgi:peptide deformylase
MSNQAEPLGSVGSDAEVFVSLLKIARLGHPILRTMAEPVSPERVTTPAFQQFVDDMVETMRDSDGVGLAAPQVFASDRVIVAEVRGPNPRYPDAAGIPLAVLVNPVITKHGDVKEPGWEGCLSLPDIRGRVPRWAAITVDALDRTGRPVTIEAAGFFARIIQHEIDHLDGVMFLDRMDDLMTLTHLTEFHRYWQPSVPVEAPK